MAKLHQIVAVVSGKKQHLQRTLTDAYHKLKQSALFDGISRRYQPRADDGQKLPDESKNVQYTAWQAIADGTVAFMEVIDCVATQDATNTQATADITVDGETIAERVPVTHLMYLEKQLTDVLTFIGNLPTLDPADKWEFDETADCYRSATYQTAKTNKFPKSFVKYEATKEHPAQVEIFNEDVVVGDWSTTKFSGAIPVSDKNAMLERCRKLIEAVKVAREEANQVEIEQRTLGMPILQYVFDDYL